MKDMGETTGTWDDLYSDMGKAEHFIYAVGMYQIQHEHIQPPVNNKYFSAVGFRANVVEVYTVADLMPRRCGIPCLQPLQQPMHAR